MRVFVTGASGFIGSAVVPELRGAGHQVVALARSDAAAAALTAAGAEVHRGSLEDVDALRTGAEAADGVIHLAFIHDFARYTAAAEVDLTAIETLGAVLHGSDRPLVITSGTLGLAPGRIGTEADRPDPRQSPRGRKAGLALALAGGGVRSSSVRLAPSVHGDGDHGFVPQLISVARDKGVSAYIDEGANRWTAVHRLDAAHLFRLALEQAPAGSALHGVADEGVTTRAIAEAIGRHLDVPVVSVSADEAAAHFGWIGASFPRGGGARSAIPRQLLGWEPPHPGLLADLAAGHSSDGARREESLGN